MSVETMLARIKKEALNCAKCGHTKFTVSKTKEPQIYSVTCKICGHSRIEIDYDEAEKEEKRN